MKKIIIGCIVSFSMFTTLPANAGLSDTQEGAIMGIIGTVLFQKIRDNTRSYRPATETPYPTAAGNSQYSELDPVKRAYDQGVRERQQEELAKKQQYAYECGKYGRNCDKL